MCECRSRIDGILKEKNARLAFGFIADERIMNVSPPMIMVEKIDQKGKKPPTLLATYCPFCGHRCAV